MSFYNIYPDEQIKFILNNFSQYGHILYDTIIERIDILLEYFIGVNIGYAIINVNKIFILIYMVLLIISIFYDKEKICLNKYEKFLFIFISVFCLFNLLTYIYIYINAVQAEIIGNLHGRYFIPIIILILLSFKNKMKGIENKNIIYIFISIIYLVNMIFIKEIIQYFLK